MNQFGRCRISQVQYYFTYTVDLPYELTKHFLAYVRWYQPASSPNVRYHFNIKETCNVEL
ncbi:425_t:CDS:2 [Funneliformis geosporum]|uniref:425_t:CDS:1 n=1 Tax=Funneliformis geosporum TaxID=1117311 RepID=A0A9W4SL32_9GLOM|nr:425_t:CDS:2 [Funneliformis geosporum]